MTKTRTVALLALPILSIGVFAAIFLKSPAAWQVTEPEEGFDSSRLAALARELTVGNRTAPDTFWEELQGKAPLIEPVADDPASSWITFVWRGDSRTRRMNVQGGPATGDFANWMERLGNTDLWYRTDRVPSDARFVYFFQVNRPLKFPPHDYNLLAENHRFRDVLQAKGYTVRYREFSGGHDLLGWRGPFVEGLVTLTAAAEQK